MTQTQTQQNQDRISRQQIKSVMAEVNGRCICVREGPNNSELQFWRVGDSVVIVQLFAGGNGWTHYLPSTKHEIIDSITELKSLT